MRAPASRCRAQHGVTLVELMIGMLIGLFLVGVAGTMFLGSKGSFRAQDQQARLQENARFVVDTLSTDLRMAGFRGCRGSAGSAPVTNTLSSPTDFRYNFAQGLWASRHTGSAWSPALPSVLTGLSPAPASTGNVLTVRRSVGPGLGLSAEMSSGSSALTVSTGAAVTQGNLLMVSDCAGSAYFQASNATPSTAGSIEHTTGGALTPGNATATLGRAFLQDALVHRMATVSYYLAPSARTGKTTLNALWSHTTPVYDGSVQPQELVTGVDGMVVRLGLDTNADGSADAYVTPDGVADWNQVVSAQVELLLAGTEAQGTSAAQPYVFNGTTTTPNDRRLRTVVTVTASVRNSLR